MPSRTWFFLEIKYVLIFLSSFYAVWLIIHVFLRLPDILTQKGEHILVEHELVRIIGMSLVEVVTQAGLVYAVLTEQFICSGCLTTISATSIVYHATQLSKSVHEWTCLWNAVTVTCVSFLWLFYLYRIIQREKEAAKGTARPFNLKFKRTRNPPKTESTSTRTDTVTSPDTTAETHRNLDSSPTSPP